MKNVNRYLTLVITVAALLCPGSADAFDQTIYDAQKKLEELGYDPGIVDGIRGKKTVTAIKLFQEDSGLPVTGRLDSQTVAKLNAQQAPAPFSMNDAVRLNDIVLVKSLIEGGADVNERDKLGETPLHVAVVRGYRGIAALLLENGADVNAEDVRGLTPVHAAAWRGYRDTVDLLITHGADINARDKEGLTPLHTAALAGRKQTVDLLIENGADVNAKSSKSLTPLHAAAMSGDSETVSLLIDKGADVDSRSNEGMTAMRIATQQEHQEVVNLLKQHQAEE